MMKKLTILFLLLVSTLHAQQSYDLRNVLTGNGSASWVPDIQDQGIFGDCWSFASATAMNSNLLMSGLLPQVSTPPPIQISSWHLSTANGSPESLVGPNYGGNGNASWGGFEYQALGYATRGQGQWAIPGVSPSSTTHITTMGGGPVLDSQNSQNPFPAVLQNNSPANIGYLIPPASQTPAYVVTSVTMYDQGFSNNVALPSPITPGGSNYNFNLGAADPQVAAVKQALLSKGALTTSMNADYSYFNYVANGNGTYTVNYFNPGQNPNNTDHEVTIIGWDDNYSMTNPTTNATTTGAWIVQNSWGKSYWTSNDPYPNNGTFYASYNDASIGRTGVASFELAPTGGYAPTVLQNELGPMSYANNYPAGQGPLGMAQRNETKGASILQPTSDGQLIALGLATQFAGAEVTVNIYDDWISGPANLLATDTFLLNGIGYQLNSLTTPLNLISGNSIVIELVYNTPGAMPVVIGGTGLNGYLNVPDGLSYYWDEATSTWKDFSQVGFTAYSGSPDITGGILFVKGLTAVPEPGTCLLLAFSGVVLLLRRKAKPRGF